MKSKLMLSAIVLINAALLSLLFAGAGFGAVQLTCQSLVDGDWSNVNTWSCTTRPGASDDVIIDTEVTITENEQAHNITITANGDLVSEGDLSISGNLLNEGFLTAGTYTVTFDGQAGAQVISYTDSTDLEFYNLRFENDGSAGPVILENLVEVNNTATVASGALVDLGDNFLSVNGVFSSSGTLRQTRLVSGTVQFPATQQFAAVANESFIGAAITTVNGLGNITFTLQSQTSECTNQPMSLHALRCFTIEAENTGLSATLRLYALRSELNGITDIHVAPYRHVPGVGWVKLDNWTNGTQGSEYVFGEGITQGFSSFLLGLDTEAPTAVEVRSLEAHSPTPNNEVFALGLLVIGGLLVGWQVRQRSNFPKV